MFECKGSVKANRIKGNIFTYQEIPKLNICNVFVKNIMVATIHKDHPYWIKIREIFEKWEEEEENQIDFDEQFRNVNNSGPKVECLK